MNRNEITVKFAELVDRMESLNKRVSGKWLWPMQSYRNNRLSEFGVYDYSTKRYVLCDANDRDVVVRLNEVNQLISLAEKRAASRS